MNSLNAFEIVEICRTKIELSILLNPDNINIEV